MADVKYVDYAALNKFAVDVRKLLDKRVWTDYGFEVAVDTDTPADKNSYLWGKYALYNATTKTYDAESKKKICALPATVASGEVVETKDADGKLTKSVIKLTLTDETTKEIDITTYAKAIEKNTADIATLNGADTVEGSVKNSIKTLAKDANSGIKGYELIAEPHTFITPVTYDALAPEDKALYQVSTKDITIEQSIADAKASATSGSVVTVEKLATAEDTYAATYVVKQNGTKVGDSINIPKDYLVKSATLKTCTVDDDPEAGYKVGDKYIDFVVNSVDGTGTESHIYINVKDLVDVYTGKAEENGISVTISNTNEISAAVAGKAIARANITTEFEANIAALEGTHAKDGDNLKSVATEISETAKDATYKAATETEAKVTIAEAIKANSDAIGNFKPASDQDIDDLFPELV